MHAAQGAFLSDCGIIFLKALSQLHNIPLVEQVST
jgi:hypothetical protein